MVQRGFGVGRGPGVRDLGFRGDRGWSLRYVVGVQVQESLGSIGQGVRGLQDLEKKYDSVPTVISPSDC